jgi:hypothetical protein
MLDLDDLPDAVCVLDPKSSAVQDTNRRFLHNISSIATGIPFIDNFIGKEDQARFASAIKNLVGESETDSDTSSILPIIRDCDTLTSKTRFSVFLHFQLDSLEGID